MKNVIRVFVLSLVASGAAASAHFSNQTSAPVLHAKVSALPIPLCPPGDPEACHLCGLGGCIN
jgi:hypothetical protein